MSKYTIYGDDGKTPVMEFDSEKENPEFYQMLQNSGNVLKTLNQIDQKLPNQFPNIGSSLFCFSKRLKIINNTESDLHKLYDKSVKPIVNKLKNFIIAPKISVSVSAFSGQFSALAIAQAQFISGDLERTFDRIMNRCLTTRADLLSRFSLALAILSVLLGIIGAVSLFK